MAKTKRLRFFAGPNGSGKSTLFEVIAAQFSTGLFVNSDVIEYAISQRGFINLTSFGLKLTQADLEEFYLFPASVSLLEKASANGHEVKILIKENVLVDKSKETHSYEASLITSFIRYHLMNKGISYSFESVMSHPSKLEEINQAQKLGYKSYLYFVCTDDPTLNVSRVSNRIEKGGHGVSEEKIISRYSRTLDLLLPALQLCDTSFLFDNSSQNMLLIAKVEKGISTILVE
ncbi:MAG: zeta toxin family protein, partial [Sphingobacterium sp.]